MRQNPHIPERTATGLWIAMQSADLRLQTVSVAACRILATAVLQGPAIRNAQVSGALPGEFHPAELKFQYPW